MGAHLRGNQKAFHFCTEKTWYGKEESKSKAGIAAAFGSVLDYNVGCGLGPHVEKYGVRSLRNLFQESFRFHSKPRTSSLVSGAPLMVCWVWRCSAFTY